MRLSLQTGYLFRHADQIGYVLPKSAGYYKMYYHLNKVLKDLGLKTGETPHSLRAGSTMSLVATQAMSLEIRGHIGWSTKKCWTFIQGHRRARGQIWLPGLQVEEAAIQSQDAMSSSSLKHAF